jgi:hypothetical protein
MKKVFVNFRNDKPHSKFMNGTYVKEMSLPFFLIDDDEREIGNDVAICQALDNYDIPWTGKFNDSHIEHIPNGSTFIFSKEIISDTPMFA